MTKTMITASVAALLFAGASAVSNANIPFNLNLDCTPCIRGGYEYCIYGSYQAAGNPTGSAWNCTQQKKEPSFVWPSQSVASGYVCSSAVQSESAAIISGCRPWNKQPDYCGGYLVNLDTTSTFDVRQIQSMPLLGACTYRVVSNCGYPTVALKIDNATFANDFDVIYGTRSNIQRDADLGSDFELSDTNVEWEGNFQTGSASALEFISQAPSSAKIDDDTFKTCKGATRSLWLTITRTKVSTPTPALFEMTPRQLQVGPGVLSYDIQVGFTSTQGSNGKILGAISFALVALLSVFAF